MLETKTTIAAISTPPGTGGIAVIRVSGTEAVEIVNKIFVPRNKNISTLHEKGNRIIYGDIVDSGNIIDEVLISIFKNPHSFTGEDTVEISCHGSSYIQQEILKLLVDNGCRIANAGEFSQWAFLNGKLDLSQAEGIADLIASSSGAAHKMALSQMRGGFSSELEKLRENLLNFVSLIELELDFNEEDVEFADREELSKLAINIESTISKLSDSFRIGNVLKNGIPVALVGETNVGKSTLLNVLLKEEKAIVSEIHGTTRDIIEDSIVIKDITFRFIDTAGIRETKDKIENLGIERTYQKIEQANIILWLIDCTEISDRIEWLTENLLKRTHDKKIILVFNKVDKISNEEYEVLEELFHSFDAEKIYISAKNDINIDKLEGALIHAAQLPELQPSDIIINNVRHYEALQKALAAIQRVNAGLENKIPHDLLSQDIRECMHFLGEITGGTISNNEVLQNIFGRFCIGK